MRPRWGQLSVSRRVLVATVVILTFCRGAAGSLSVRVESLGGVRGGPVFAMGGVVWAQADARGRVAVVLARSGRALRELVRLAPPAAPSYQVLSLTGSDGAIAIVHSIVRPGSGRTMVPQLQSTEVLVARSGARVRRLFGCRSSGYYPQLQAAVAGSIVATLGNDCASLPHRIALRDLVTGIASFYSDGRGDQVTQLEGAGDYLAWQRYLPAAPNGLLKSELVVFDAVTRAVAYRIALPGETGSPFAHFSDYALGPDGTVVIHVQTPGAADVPCAYWYALRDPNPHPVPRSISCAPYAERLVRGELVGLSGVGLSVNDLVGNGHYLPLVDPEIVGGPDFNGLLVAYASRGCDHDTVVLVPARATGGPTNQLASGCVIAAAAPARGLSASNRVALVRASCTTGCRGLFVLYERVRCYPGSRLYGCRRVLAARAIRLPASSDDRILAIPLSPTARRFVACRHTLNVNYAMDSLLAGGADPPVPMSDRPITLRSRMSPPPGSACRRAQRSLPLTRIGASW